MPLFGALQTDQLRDAAPRVGSLATSPLALEDVELLQVMYEVEVAGSAELLPPALHPTNPPTVTWQVKRVADSDFGPYTLALTRLGARAGAKLRGYSLSCFIDNDLAAEALRTRWGYPTRRAEVALDVSHHVIKAAVAVDGDRVLEVALHDPEPIVGGDVYYTATMNLGLVQDRLRLVQADTEYEFKQATRGRPELSLFAAESCGAGGLTPTWPVGASYARVQATLETVRYLCDPALPAVRGTEKVG